MSYWPSTDFKLSTSNRAQQAGLRHSVCWPRGKPPGLVGPPSSSARHYTSLPRAFGSGSPTWTMCSRPGLPKTMPAGSAHGWLPHDCWTGFRTNPQPPKRAPSSPSSTPVWRPTWSPGRWSSMWRWQFDIPPTPFPFCTSDLARSPEPEKHGGPLRGRRSVSHAGHGRLLGVVHSPRLADHRDLDLAGVLHSLLDLLGHLARQPRRLQVIDIFGLHDDTDLAPGL